ncbi:thiopeptide-type bacteriocin biosynthesis protein [Micromonospora sp. C32]|uniref:thiopeptide-type bacteriocin biosynthesis protein n=1 Tax=unclassified Micromonospora TaxID=2617518 RepID=UPI001B37E486|nr:thiopeptide-type bacteriocin biosynthesis protein [Micromonospora sp. C32]MBQ1055143.1 thiopeptide-type bacteriocin biosynthesis protein [Micromonospora sp. C32]
MELSALEWCLVRVPMLPAAGRPGGDAVEEDLPQRLLDLALHYVATYGRSPDEDQSWRDDPALGAVYANRARHRPVPFGLFTFSALADVVEHAGPTRVDLATEVLVHRVDPAQATDDWFVNPTLAADSGRWMYVRSDRNGSVSAPDTAGVRHVVSLRDAGPRPASAWIADLGPDLFEQYGQRQLLLRAHTPEPFLDPGGTAEQVADPVGAVRIEERPFRPDQFVEAYTEVRPTIGRAAAGALVAGAERALRAVPPSELMQPVRSYLESSVTGAAVPLSWLLSAPRDHPLGGWRREPRESVEPEPHRYPTAPRRLFVPAAQRDHTLVEWWHADHDFDRWFPPDEAPPAPVDGPRHGLAHGAVLGEPVSGADVWLKGVMPKLSAGPAARIADRLKLPPQPATDGSGRLVVELGWTPLDKRWPLNRRPAEARRRRFNVNLPRRPGDIGPDDLMVTVLEGRLHLVHRHDGRLVDLRFDSMVTLGHPLNPWVVRLLALIAEDTGGCMADPLYVLPPGAVVPRIVGGRCLFARRGVVLDAQHRADLLALADDPAALSGVLTEVGLGPVVEVTEEVPDRVMRIDVTDPEQRLWLRRRLRRTGRLLLQEVLPLASPVTSGLGEHLHDVWVPWLRTDVPPSPRLSTTRMVDRPPTPDPDWTSWYVYAPDLVVESWLARADVVDLMDRAELFYIRYRDERPHLRIRLRSTVPRDDLLASLRAHLDAQSPHHHCEIDERPWTPEDHRYGGREARPAVLRHFCADSAWWARHLAARPRQPARYTLAAARIAAWAHQLAGTDALSLFADLRGLDPRLPSSRDQREWMATYRTNRRDLERGLSRELDRPDPTLDLLSGLDPDAYRLTLNSMIHMTVNRGMPVVEAVPREREIVLAAARVLKSHAARLGHDA